MKPKSKQLLPVRHAWVRQQKSNGDDRFGRVESAIDTGERVQVTVKWQGTGESSTLPLSELRCGFKAMMEVQDVPNSRTRKPLGEGIILRTRTLGGRDQVLVDFAQTGKQAANAPN